MAQRRPPLAPRLLGSFFSVLAGLAVLAVSYYIWAAAEGKFVPLGFLIVVAIYGAAFALPVWLIVLLPLYLFVPAGSALWRWPVCTLCGAVAGAVIIFAWFGRSGIEWRLLPLIFLGALTGAATCLFGSLTAGFFRGEGET